MMRVLLLLGIALPAWAQQPQTPPAEPKKEAEQRRPLNLRLDNPSSFATIAPAEKEESKVLPTLGADARKPPPVVREGMPRTEGGPFPKDTAPNY
jgi:hypothetical protein